MAKLITHKFVSAIPDGDDTSVVRPSNWNDTHDVSGVAESGANTDITSMTGITGGISSPDYIGFDTTYATPLTAGQLGWDGNNTLAIGMAGGNVIQHIGEDSYFYIKASSAITKGQLIMFTGAVGASGVLTGAPSTGVTVGSYIMGVAAEDIANNGFGLVQCFGELTGVNTNSFNEGDILYYNSAVTGGLTSTFPTSGPIVQVAAVAKKSAGSGVIYIRVSVTQRITAGTGASVSQTSTGTSIAVANPYDPAAVAITGGTINGTTIGATTPSTGTFTTLTAQTEVLKGTGNNILLQSNTFNTTWATVASTIATTVATTDPFGGSNAWILTPTSSVTTGLTQTVTNANGTYTLSLYAKAGTATWLRLFANSTVPYAWFNLSTGAVGTVQAGGTATITSAGNGWYRCSITSNSNNTIGIRIADADASTSGITGQYIYIYGSQLEIGSTTNTYTPTTTTAVYGTPSLSFSGVSEIGLESNGALHLQPAGTGAIQAQATTSSATGGNARGANAVDWQTSRGSASQVASGQYGVISGGVNNAVTGFGGVVSGGSGNQASSNIYSAVVGGTSNIATGERSFIGGGSANTVAGYLNFVGGGFTNSATSGTAVTTQSGTMNGTTAVTLSGSNASIKVGQYITGTSIANNTYVAAISGTSLTLSQNASGSSTSTLSFYTPHGVVVGGGNNQATGSYSFIGGGGDAGTAANRNVASGDWSFVGGGGKNVASGTGSVVCGGGNFGSGFSQNTASGVSAFIGAGYNNTSAGFTGGILCGTNNTQNGNFSAVLGGASGGTRAINANFVFPSANPLNSNSALTQAALLVLARQTTDATPTVLASDGSAAGTTNQVILPNNSAYFVRGTIIAGVTGGGNTSAWDFKGAIKRGANAASTALVGVGISSNLVAQDAGAATWAVAITADTTNGGLKVTVTGQAATTIRWVCEIETTEMTY